MPIYRNCRQFSRLLIRLNLSSVTVFNEIDFLKKNELKYNYNVKSLFHAVCKSHENYNCDLDEVVFKYQN